MCPCWHYGVGFFLSDIYKAIYHLSVLRNEYFLKKFLQDQCICYAVDILACKTQMNEDLQPLLSSLLQLLLQVKLCCLTSCLTLFSICLTLFTDTSNSGKSTSGAIPLLTKKRRYSLSTCTLALIKAGSEK